MHSSVSYEGLIFARLFIPIAQQHLPRKMLDLDQNGSHLRSPAALAAFRSGLFGARIAPVEAAASARSLAFCLADTKDDVRILPKYFYHSCSKNELFVMQVTTGVLAGPDWVGACIAQRRVVRVEGEG
jgi:hypothetical protein